MVKDHSDSERGNPQPPLHELIFSISSNTFTIVSIIWVVIGAAFICTIPQTG